MTVIEYCRHETRVYELVIIRAGGRVRCSAYIDHEDLFRLPLDIGRAPPRASPLQKSSTTLLGLSGLTLAMAFMPHDFIGMSYRQTVISNGN